MADVEDRRWGLPSEEYAKLFNLLDRAWTPQMGHKGVVGRAIRALDFFAGERGCKTVDDLRESVCRDLLKVPNVGSKTMAFVATALAVPDSMRKVCPHCGGPL